MCFLQYLALPLDARATCYCQNQTQISALSWDVPKVLENPVLLPDQKCASSSCSCEDLRPVQANVLWAVISFHLKDKVLKYFSVFQPFPIISEAQKRNFTWKQILLHFLSFEVLVNLEKQISLIPLVPCKSVFSLLGPCWDKSVCYMGSKKIMYRTPKTVVQQLIYWKLLSRMFSASSEKHCHFSRNNFHR